MIRCNVITLCFVTMLFHFVTAFSAVPLSEKIEAESVLPAYLNRDEAVLVVRSTVSLEEVIELKVDFIDKDTGYIPHPPVVFEIAPENSYGIYVDQHITTNFIDIPDIDISSDGDAFDELTIAFWAKGDVGPDNNVTMLWAYGGSTGSEIPLKGYFPFYNTVTGSYQYQLQNFGPDGAMETGPYNSSLQESRDGQWHHWVFQKDAQLGLTRVYVDGVLKGSRAETYRRIWPITDLRFGGNGSQASAYNGYLKDLRIYGAALDQTEIIQVMQGMHPTAALLGWWKFDEGEGSVVYDHSGNNYTGYVVGSGPAIWLDSSSEKQITLDISTWPDGEYKAVISENVPSPDSVMVRAIRKQTLLAPNLPEEPIDVGGLNMLFVDDWYIHDKENLNVVVNSPEHYPIVSESTFADYTYYRTGLARFFTDGNETYAELVGREYFPTDEPVYYYKKSSNLKDWTLVEKEAFEVGYQQWLLKNTPPSGGNMVSKYYSNPDGNDVVYRFYEEADGDVPLSEVEIRYIGWFEGEVTWGDISLPSRNTYAVWLKSPDETVILGDPITTDKWLFGDNEIGEWHNSNDNLGTQRLIADADGLRLQFSQSRLIPRNDPFRVHYDNIWANRIQVSWTTTDGLNWEPTYFSVPDFDDAQELQHYDVKIFNQEKDNLRLAYLRMYDQAKQQIYTELLYSRNGLLWNRFPGRPRFLDNGEQGSWNFGYSMFPDREPLEHNGYLYQPTTGISCLHFMYLCAFHRTFHRDNITLSWLEGWQGGRLFGDNGLETSPVWSHYGSWDAILTDIHNARTIPGLVRIRKDGWVSLDADGTPGHMITKVLDAENNIYINGTTESDGSITVEVLDAEGHVLQDYCGQNAAVFSGDSARHLIKWSDGQISQLPGQPIRLKITLHNAKLYSVFFRKEISIEEFMDVDPLDHGWHIPSGAAGHYVLSEGIMNWPDGAGLSDMLNYSLSEDVYGPTGSLSIDVVWRSDGTEGVGIYAGLIHEASADCAVIGFTSHTQSGSDPSQTVRIQRGYASLQNDAVIPGFSGGFITGRFIIDAEENRIFYRLEDETHSASGVVLVDWVGTGAYQPYISIRSNAGCTGQIAYLNVTRRADSLIPGDINDDGIVDFSDFSALAAKWNKDNWVERESQKNLLLGWWKFDEGSGSTIYDHSGNNRTATAIGAGPHLWDPEGGIYVDQHTTTNYINIPNIDISADGMPVDAISIAFWAKGDTEPDNRVLIFWGTGIQSPDGVVLRSYFPSHDLIYRNTWTTIDGNRNIDYASPLMESRDGQWHHWVFVSDARSGMFKTYVDGELKATAGGAGPIHPITNLRFGGNGSELVAYDGCLKDLRIYNFAVDQEGVNLIFLGQHPENLDEPEIDGNLLGWWKFDEGGGSTVDDHSVNNWTGTVIGSGPHIWDPDGGLYVDQHGNTDYVEISDIFIAGDNGRWFDAITMTFWAKGDPGLTNNAMVLLGIGGPGGGQESVTGYFPYYNTSTGLYQYQVQYRGPAGTEQAVYSSALQESRDGQWRHWAFQKDAQQNTMRIWLDGILVASRSGNYPVYPIEYLMFGSGGTQATAYKGYLKDLRIYDFLLDQSAVNQVKAGGHPVPPIPPEPEYECGKDGFFLEDLTMDCYVGMDDLIVLLENWLAFEL